MEAEKEVQQFAVSWAEAWTRAEERAWAQAKAMLAGRLSEEAAQRRVASALALGEGRVAEALLLGEALGEARARARAHRLAKTDPQTIANILTSLNRARISRHLFSRDEYSCIIQFIAPITRLPIELLRQIFLAIIEETSGSPLPLVLMLVCKQWHAIVTSIWASLNLGTTTPAYTVTRMNQWLLDIVVDTDSDRGRFTPSGGPFEAIFAAIEATPRWRSFVIESFPAQADLPEDLVNLHLQRSSDATMSRFTTFKVKSSCETSPLLNSLLHILGTTAGSALTIVEINSPNVISFLAPTYSSFFHSVRVLSLSSPGIHDPVDLLPHLYQLETFTVSRLSFPTYPNHVELPFVRTLRHLTLRATSIQWMSGRIFHALEHCALIFPRQQHVLHTFHTTLPNCNHLTFQGYPLTILGGLSAHKLNHISVTCSGPFNRHGSRQLVWFSAQVLGEHQLAPKTLHISIQATDQAWMSSLIFMSNLEELVIHCAQPSSLGATVLQSLVLRPVHTSNMGMASSPRALSAPLCPSLRRFGLKYNRWLRPTEQFDLIPVLVSFIQSRQHSNYALESFDLWTTSEQRTPLKLIERSRMNIEGLKQLAEESGIEEDLQLAEEGGIGEDLQLAEGGGIGEDLQLAEEGGIEEDLQLAEEGGIGEDLQVAEEGEIGEDLQLTEEGGIEEDLQLAEEGGVGEDLQLAEEGGIGEDSQLADGGGIEEDLQLAEDGGIGEDLQLAEEGGVGEDLLDFEAKGLMKVTPKPSGESSLSAPAFPSQDSQDSQPNYRRSYFGHWVRLCLSALGL